MSVLPEMRSRLCGVYALALLFMASPLATMAEQCNVGREECGFLNNRQCPDASSGHPDHLNRCCQRDRMDCYTACCADYFGSSGAVIVILIIFVTFCLLCPLLAYCCKRCGAIRAQRQNERTVEEQLQRTERSFDEREHARRANQRTEAPPCYYGPNEKAPDYEQALGHTVLVPSGESTANLMANAQGTTPPATTSIPSPRNPGTNSSFAASPHPLDSSSRSRSSSHPHEQQQQQQQQQQQHSGSARNGNGIAEVAGREYEAQQQQQQASQSNATAEIDFRAPTPSDPPAYDSLMVPADDSTSETSQLTDSLPANPAPASVSVRALRPHMLRQNTTRSTEESSQRSATPLSELEEQDV